MPMQATTTSPLFSAALKPDRSPRVAGGWIAFAAATVMGAPFAVLVPEALVPAIVAFCAGGAGLTVMTVRKARQLSIVEQITLWPDQLEIVSIDGGGTRSLRRFDPHLVRLVLERDENEKTTAVHLRAGSEAVEIGACLKSEDKSSFAKALGTALRRARHLQ